LGILELRVAVGLNAGTCGSGSWRRFEEQLGREMGMRERERKRDTMSEHEKRVVVLRCGFGLVALRRLSPLGLMGAWHAWSWA
jgi:hypothetical protein